MNDFDRSQNNPYSNTYNLGWRNHPNLQWGEQSNNQRQPPQQSQQPPQQNVQNSFSRLEEMMGKLAHSVEENMKSTNARFQHQEAAIRNIEQQVGQLAQQMAKRPHDSLPSDTEKTPRNHVNAITLRSGKKVKGEEVKDKEEDSAPNPYTPPIPYPGRLVPRKKPEAEPQKVQSSSSQAEVEKPAVNPNTPPVPYPERLKKKKKDSQQFSNFVEAFKKLHINLPLVDVLKQIPNYARLLKDILANKRKLDDEETVTLNEECSAILQNKLPPKLKDPGSFTIPCQIGDVQFSKALCDLGSSINLMPYPVYMKLGIGKLKDTTMSLQLADRSIRYPKGIVENVLVKVDKFVFPADFVVLEMDEDVEVPIILGRPFLATGGALIDVREGTLVLRMGEERVTFNVLNSVNIPSKPGECWRIDKGDRKVEPTSADRVPQVGEGSKFKCRSCRKVVKPWPVSLEFKFIKFLKEGSKPKSLIEKPQASASKVLQAHLEYAFLEAPT